MGRMFSTTNTQLWPSSVQCGETGLDHYHQNHRQYLKIMIFAPFSGLSVILWMSTYANSGWAQLIWTSTLWGSLSIQIDCLFSLLLWYFIVCKEWSKFYYTNRIMIKIKFCKNINSVKTKASTLTRNVSFQIWRNVIDIWRERSQHDLGLCCQSENTRRVRQDSSVCRDKLQCDRWLLLGSCCFYGWQMLKTE